MKNRSAFFILAFAIMLCAVTTEQAAAYEKTDAMAVVHQFIDGFNKGDLTSAIAACAEESSVIDDFPPYEWQGAGCKKWADGFRAIAKKEGITAARILLGKPRHVDVTGDRAYVVVPVTLVMKHFGTPKKLPSIFTASLHTESGGWRITAWAWADL
ncbi:MAG: nuclear transport factor 2 family protein [Steroidobacteraceae bacterium]